MGYKYIELSMFNKFTTGNVPRQFRLEFAVLARYWYCTMAGSRLAVHIASKGSLDGSWELELKIDLGV